MESKSIAPDIIIIGPENKSISNNVGNVSSVQNGDRANAVDASASPSSRGKARLDYDRHQQNVAQSAAPEDPQYDDKYQYRTGLCGCCKEVDICCYTLWCPWAQSGFNRVAVEDRPYTNDDFCTNCCSNEMAVRREIRRRYGGEVNGNSKTSDCCTMFWCCPCAIGQDALELTFYQGMDPRYRALHGPPGPPAQLMVPAHADAAAIPPVAASKMPAASSISAVPVASAPAPAISPRLEPVVANNKTSPKISSVPAVPEPPPYLMVTPPVAAGMPPSVTALPYDTIAMSSPAFVAAPVVPSDVFQPLFSSVSSPVTMFPPAMPAALPNIGLMSTTVVPQDASAIAAWTPNTLNQYEKDIPVFDGEADMTPIVYKLRSDVKPDETGTGTGIPGYAQIYYASSLEDALAHARSFSSAPVASTSA